ncbi:MAG: ribosomal protein S18-alanine N-acetyltransferase [Chloroflexi bacterium]|nr:ribosomal protein S18-alanine N-acetyltransferase [Chloroflexota bacterium]
MTSLKDKTLVYVARPMRLEDVDEVAAIDREAFPTTWPAPSFRQDLMNKRYHYFVIQKESAEPAPELMPSPVLAPSSLGQRLRAWLQQQPLIPGPRGASLMGYCSLWCILDEAHLTAIAVREDQRRLGLGELLLITALHHALKLEANEFTLETRVSNYPAQALYRKYGMAQMGIRPRYYSDNLEDAYIMTARAIQSLEYRERLHALESALTQRLNWKLSP